MSSDSLRLSTDRSEALIESMLSQVELMKVGLNRIDASLSRAHETLYGDEVRKLYPEHAITKIGLGVICSLPSILSTDLGVSSDNLFVISAMDPNKMTHSKLRGIDNWGRPFLAARCAPIEEKDYTLENAKVVYVVLLRIHGPKQETWEETQVGPLFGSTFSSPGKMKEENWNDFAALLQGRDVKGADSRYYRLI
jgi:hypothetical protein